MPFDIFRSEHQDSKRLATSMTEHGGVLRLNGQRGAHETLVVIAHASEVEEFGALRLAKNIASVVFNRGSHQRIYCVICWGALVRDRQLSSIGQALANETGVPVRAATGTVHGEFEDPLDLNTEGVWVDFQPQDPVDAITDYLANLHL